MHNSSIFICCLCLLGFLAVSLSRFAQPENDVIDSFQAQDFYITYQPDSIVAPNSIDSVYLICQTNIYDGVSYQWQFSYDGVYAWSDLLDKHSNEQVFALDPMFAQRFGFYRCACTYGDTIIYTAPFSVTVPYSKEQSDSEDFTEEVMEAPTDEQKKEVEQDEKIEED